MSYTTIAIIIATLFFLIISFGLFVTVSSVATNDKNVSKRKIQVEKDLPIGTKFLYQGKQLTVISNMIYVYGMLFRIKCDYLDNHGNIQSITFYPESVDYLIDLVRQQKVNNTHQLAP